jgi:hypothetical protein
MRVMLVQQETRETRDLGQTQEDLVIQEIQGHQEAQEIQVQTPLTHM